MNAYEHNLILRLITVLDDGEDHTAQCKSHWYVGCDCDKRNAIAAAKTYILTNTPNVINNTGIGDPCPGCPPGIVCRTIACGRLTKRQ